MADRARRGMGTCRERCRILPGAARGEDDRGGDEAAASPPLIRSSRRRGQTDLTVCTRICSGDPTAKPTRLGDVTIHGSVML